jgi:predicted nucleic acid-binding protein
VSEIQRVLPDSNIVYSASRDLTSSFRLFWSLPSVEILVSRYIVDEVTRHLVRPDHRANLWQLLYRSHLVSDGEEIELPPGVNLPAKDRPILQSAVAGSAHILVTGDKNHFGSLFGSTILGVRIETPAMFKRRYPEFFGAEQT